MTTKYVEISRAHCKNCGDKAGMYYQGQLYPFPIVVPMATVEKTPWVCQCRKKVELDVQVLEGE